MSKRMVRTGRNVTNDCVVEVSSVVGSVLQLSNRRGLRHLGLDRLTLCSSGVTGSEQKIRRQFHHRFLCLAPFRSSLPFPRPCVVGSPPRQAHALLVTIVIPRHPYLLKVLPSTVQFAVKYLQFPNHHILEHILMHAYRCTAATAV